MVTLLSGGLDSTVLAYMLHRLNYLQTFISFNYGQKHLRELDCAAQTAVALNCAHHIIDLSCVNDLWQSSSIVGPQAVPEGHYAAPNMASTVVPNRNMLFITFAGILAVNVGAAHVCLAVHAGDHPIYPDCRPDFISAITRTLQLSCGVAVEAPFSGYTKSDIVLLGEQNQADFANTWSCYKGGARHCGLCGTCVERKEAFLLAGVDDPTVYDA